MSEQELRAKLKYANSDLQRDAAFAKYVLDEDLLHFDGNFSHSLKLDQRQRDQLAAATRQDAAHSIIAISRLGKELKSIKAIVLAQLALTVVLIFLVWKMNSLPPVSSSPIS